MVVENILNELPLLKVGEMLGLDAASIQDVRLAYEHPKRYLEVFGDRLEERNVLETSNDLPWIALVDALIDKELAEEIDWKESFEVITDVVEQLLKKKNLFSFDWEELNHTDYELFSEDALATLASELKRNATSLAYLDIDSDSYVLVVAKIVDMIELKKLAAQSGFAIIDEFLED